jgi:hypothetical protein
MHLDPSKVNADEFHLKPCIFGGDECIWVYPKLQGIKWTNETEVLRSSIWRKSDGALISAGLKKFFNWGEQPHLHPAPDKLQKGMSFMEKLDGSCLIVSKYKGELITRTRKAHTGLHLNGNEIQLLFNKYPVFEAYIDGHETSNASYIFEWLTPSNKIVLNYDEPDMKLLVVISHSDYGYFSQTQTDQIAKDLQLLRPERFQIDTNDSVEDFTAKIKAWKGREGLCVYFNADQHIRKTKSDWYNALHTFKGDVTLVNMVDVFLELGMPSFEEFTKHIEETYGWEGLQIAIPLMSKVCDARKNADAIIEGMHNFIATQCKQLPTRKLQAEKVIGAYGKTTRATILFTLLDGKVVDNKSYKKLIMQSLPL